MTHVGAVILSSAIEGAYSAAQSLLAYSSPLVVYLLFAKQGLGARLLWIAGTVPLVAHVWSSQPAFGPVAVRALFAQVYFLGVTVAVYRVRARVRALRLGGDTLFCLLFVAYVGVASLLFREFGMLAALVVGWLLTMSSYSFWVETEHNGSEMRLSEFLFFSFVDPCLCVPGRASRTTQDLPAGSMVRRLALGLVQMVAGRVLLGQLPSINKVLPSDSGGVANYGNTLALGLLLFVAIYWARCGIIQVKIGALGLVGFRVPESYRTPYLARTPRDFWDRWNLYVGAWFRRYVYTPLALRLTRTARRRWPEARSRAPQAIAALVTFVAVGLLHDALNFAGEAQTRFVFLKMFAFAAVGLLAWEAGPILVGRLLGRVELPQTARTLLGRVYTAHYVVGLVVLSGSI